MESAMSETVVYRARRILTLDPARPQATHVAVRDGRILAVGDRSDVDAWGSARHDDRYDQSVLLPGFVEGHSHLSEGGFWRYVYCGFHDRVDPDGRLWRGADSIEAVVERLRQAQAKLPMAELSGQEPEPLIGWGFDPIYFGTRRCTRHDLDQVSALRPVAILHASGHITNANSAALRKADYLHGRHTHDGVLKAQDGLPTGELRGPDVFTPVLVALGMDRAAMSGDAKGLLAFSRSAVRAGVTTATDLATPLPDDAVDELLRMTGAEDFPIRLVPAMHVRGQTAERAIERALALKARSTDRLRLGRVKAHADGSIQGFSARLRWPGYFNGAPQGLWYVEPEYLRHVYTLGLQHGVQIHTHTNGDEAIDLAIECMAHALERHPRFDHRYTLQHCQMADQAQLQRMKALGMCANFFANHHFYWGDAHHDTTLGPDRAQRMNPVRSALEVGLRFGMHTDAPVTPLAPLHVAWCAVNRLTASGRVLGEHERIGVFDALRAITLGPAYTLHLDHEIGTIECGKRADFAVLAEDPTTVSPDRLRDIRVLGTVQGGRVFDAPHMVS
jgi:predicted amidohydrolase YtcJ